jgi:uncharacterized membrane protein
MSDDTSITSIKPNHGPFERQLYRLSAWIVTSFWVFCFAIIIPYVSYKKDPNPNTFLIIWMVYGFFVLFPATIALLIGMCSHLIWSARSIGRKILLVTLLIFTGTISPTIYYFCIYRKWDAATRKTTTS